MVLLWNLVGLYELTLDCGGDEVGAAHAVFAVLDKVQEAVV